MSKSRFLGPAAGAVVGRGGAVGSSFLLTLLVARLLSTDDSGVFFSFLTLATLIATVGRFGVDNMVLKLLGGRNQQPLGELLSLMLLSLVVSGVLTLILCVAFLVLGTSIAGITVTTLCLASTVIVPLALSVIAGTVLRAAGRIGLGVMAEMGSVPALTLIGALVVYQAGSLELNAVVLTYTIAAWITLLWSLGIAGRHLAQQYSLRAAPSSIRDVTGTIRPLFFMMLTALMKYAQVWAPLFVLMAFGSMTAVSLYTVAARFVNVLQFIPAIQLSYLAPRFARLYQSADLESLNVLTRRSSRQSILVALGPALVLILFSSPLMTWLYGESFTQAGSVLSVLCISMVITVALGQVLQLLLLTDLEKIAVLTTGMSLVLWALLGWFAAAQGVFWVAVLSAILDVSVAVICAVVLKRRRQIVSHA